MAADGDRQFELVKSLAEEAEEILSPCGRGYMIWRAWGKGPLLVLLHGGYGSWAHWVRNIRPLASRFRVIAPDLPGLGDSATPPLPYTPEGLAEIVAAGLDEVVSPGTTVALVGFSFGAMLGGLVAARRAAMVRSLTLVGAASLGLPRGQMDELQSARPHMSAEAIRDLHRTNLGILMFADAAKVDDLAVGIQSENVGRARVKSRPFARTAVLAEVLPEIRARLSGIWGERDVTAYPFVEERRRLLRSLQPEAPFHVIPGAGHWVQYEAADAFNQALLQVIS